MVNDTKRITRSQRRVLAVLERGGWACGADFMGAGTGWAFATRISELRALGFEIEKRRCSRHPHRAAVCEYRIGRGDHVG